MRSAAGWIYNTSSSLTLQDVTFSGNAAIEGWGGGMYNSSSSPMLANAATGQAIDLSQGASLSVVSQSPSGTMLLLSRNSFRALLPTGTVDDNGETLASAPTRTVSVLLLADGGAKEPNPPDWIAALQPQVVLISADAAGRAERPAPEVLAALKGYSILRTDQNGWISLSTDGQKMWVEVERK